MLKHQPPYLRLQEFCSGSGLGGESMASRGATEAALGVPPAPPEGGGTLLSLSESSEASESSDESSDVEESPSELLEMGERRGRGALGDARGWMPAGGTPRGPPPPSRSPWRR